MQNLPLRESPKKDSRLERTIVGPTILGVPCDNYGIMGPETLLQSGRAEVRKASRKGAICECLGEEGLLSKAKAYVGGFRV